MFKVGYNLGKLTIQKGLIYNGGKHIARLFFRFINSSVSV